jgi:large repetitive protein
MSTKPSNNGSGAAQSEVPALHSFEFDKTAIGNIKSSVNKFRGSVSMPLDLMTLPGLEGLDVKLSVLYSSSIKNNLNTWNTEAPTGILGLGWQMPIEMITVDKGGSASVTSDKYYLVSSGSANPMVKTGETVNGNWIFQLRNFQFWSVQYNPALKIWIIIKEDGFTYTYGAGNDTTSNGTQWGVSWGNWIGSSNVGAAQVLYPTAWNLVSIVTPMGNSIHYQYINITQKLISSGLAYTQASYLGKVIDSYGRVITLNYGNKFGMLNPGSNSDGKPIIEYQPLHTQIAPPSPNAYQDRYETYFLDAVDVADADGHPISGMKFTYGFMNNAAPSDSNYSLMFKRCLQSVFQYSSNGETLPAMNFEYFPTNSSSTNPGALSAVIYPEGGKASFEYKIQTITSANSSKKVQLQNPITGSIPRVWFGSNYVVFTYQSSNQLQLKIQSWNGQWVSQTVNINKTVLNGSLMVQTTENFFALSLRNSSTGNDELYLFRNDDAVQDLKFGNWVMYNNQPFILTVKTNSKAQSVFVAGDSFVMAYNTDYTTNRVQGFSYNWQDGMWNGNGSPLLPNSSDCVMASITAAQNFYAVSCYIQSSRQIKNYLFYRALDGTWKAGSTWTLSNIDVVVDQPTNTAYLAISPTPSSLVLTFATTTTSTAINYSLRLFNWDENFAVLNTSSPGSVDLSSPIVSGNSLYQIFQTSIVGSTVNNNLALLRDAGGDQRYGSVWNQKSFSAPGATIGLNMATGEDISILSPASGSAPNQWAAFNPNAGNWSILSNVPSGNNPSISGNYMTVGKTIYFRGTDGTWRSLSTQLGSFNDPQSLQNRGPRFISYQDASDNTASSYVAALKNGTAQVPQKLNNVKSFVPNGTAGTMLVAGRFLVTYPSSAASFDASPTMDLWNLDEVNFNQSATDTPVAYLVIEDQYDATQNFTQSYYYANSPESQIVYNSLMGVAQYPLVMVVPGVKEKAALPTSTPEGSSHFYYSNGLAQQSTLYPSGGLQNFQNILNGIQLGQKDFAKDGSLVSSQLNYWTVYSKDVAGKYLLGGYARCEKTANMKDGVVQWSTGTYDKTTGVLLSQEKSYYDADGVQKNIRTETLYAYQVPTYAASFNKLHIFSTVAMTTQSVAPADNSSRNYIKSQATTFRNWAASTVNADCDGTGSCKLAAYQIFDWTTPGTVAPQFPSDTPTDAWRLKTKIISRSDTGNLITEQVDGNQLVSSFIYDKKQQSLVAKFPNGSLSGNEVSYYGFENYETPIGWVIGSGGNITPNSQNAIVDAHTGTHSLSIAAGSTGAAGVQGLFSPIRQDQQYIFSAWVKKPSEFNNSAGNASWKVSVPGGTSSVLNFPDTVGQWLYVSQLIDFPNPKGNTQITITCENANTSCNVLVDNLRFTPLACITEAYSYHNTLEEPTAVLGANGETKRKVLDSFQQEILSTNAADRTSKIQNGYLSRSGNLGVFVAADPNSSLTITGANGGELTEFTRGSEWSSVWQQGTGNWNVADTVLTQQSAGTAGSLTYADNEMESDFSLDVEFNLLETPVTPLGISLGSALTVQWNPQLTSWQLLDSAGANLLPPVDTRAFNLPQNPFASQLDAGTLSDALCAEFNNAGFLLPKTSSISTGAATGKGWTITSPDNAYRYALKLDGTNIAVYTMNKQWTLLMGQSTAVFWADGKIIFSYTAVANFSGVPTIFFGNKVAISQIATALTPMAAISFDDANGMHIQAQQYAGSQMVVGQLVSDNLGRMAIRTKQAYITPQQNPMFSYCSGFATMNWTTGTMTGLVSAAYPADNGYPFARQTFETSPLARVVQESIPGEDFRVNGGKCTVTSYSAVTGQSGVMIYSKKTTTNPNGNVFYEVSTLLDQVIQNVSATGTEIKNETGFDDAGNPTIVRSPNYFNPPSNSVKNDWVTLQTFDYLNQLLTMQQGTNAPTKFIYDQAGNIRFKQDQQGATDGNYIYTKYDLLSRPIETGYIAGAWNQQQLQQYANTDPLWPQNTPTWRQKNIYDGGGVGLNTIGRISSMQANNGNAGIADVTESLAYDIFGNTISDTLAVNAFDSGTNRVVNYEYNDVGTITQIQYPNETYDYAVFYQLNSLNQIIGITDQVSSQTPGQSGTSTIGNFSYDAAGTPLENQLALTNATIKQTYGFNAPNWLLNINNQTQEGSSIFRETLTYTSGGYANAGYFDGTIASSAAQVSGQANNEYQYAYDAIGQLQNAKAPANPPISTPATPDVSYDKNGNIQNFEGSNISCAYAYNQGSQQVNTISDVNNSQVIAQFAYNQNGNAISMNMADSKISKPFALGFTYDPASMLAVSVVDTTQDGSTLNFTYGCRNERLLKTVTGGVSPTGTKLYVRGTSAMPLQEVFISADGKTRSSVNYVYGPGGLIAMRKLDDGTTATLYHILSDHLGSARAVIDLNGNVVASYEYLTFGALSNINEPSPGFLPYLYTGQEFDSEIGLYNYRARFYSAAIGRFIATDPGRQYFSPYIYASNNPVLFIDPTGMFSIGSFFSAIGGIFIGAVEILIGVVIDVVAAVLEVVTGGLGTPAAIGLGALSGVFYGAGVSSITYSAFHFDDFSWKDYGIQMGIGALTGALSGGFGAGLGIAAKSAQVALTEFTATARATAGLLEVFGQPGVATAVKAGAWVTEKGAALAGLATNGPVAAGWGALAKGIGTGIIKSEVIGTAINTGKNLALGNNWDAGLSQVVFSSALSGSIGGLQVSNRIKY